jgi:2-dehydro-3-deoxyglucarate aldolase/4-hydroxy-2-oxoheptanedioate aldolase
MVRKLPKRQGKRGPEFPKLAFWLQRASLPTCEIAAFVGMDAVILDLEHGVFDAGAADEIIAAAKRLGLTVYSRVAQSERMQIQAALDSGSDGVILPQLRDLVHARQATGYAKYPPLGTRGIGFSRTHQYGGTPADFTDRENRRTLCFAMIETPGALADAEAIAALRTVDGLFVGPADLSMTRGRGPVQGNAADLADWLRAAKAAAAKRKPWATVAHDPAALAFTRQHGAAFVTVTDDLSALRQGFLSALAMAGRH